VVLLTGIGLAGCAGTADTGAATRPAQPTPASGTYTVRPGDTLYSIARGFGIDHRELARWNRLGDGTLIYPGQRLELRARKPSTDAAASPLGGPAEVPVADWRWPTDGPVLAGFRASPKTASGMHIGGYLGQPVGAAAAGEVVYAGSGLPGYGNLLIVRHNAVYLSAYGHNERLLVREGERVTAGQAVASLGIGPGQRPLLHFEIRRNGEPVDPLQYLPARR
jgi:lipoprotein NlpD